ncbi:MAG: TolC family protein [Candidatus Omnitrophota bacterium]|nr:TolC family protein [Candidatus Omnitrophota bacterium]
MKRIVLFLIIFIFLFIPDLSAEEIFLNLDEAIAIALRSNPGVLLKAKELKKAKLKIAEAKADLFPSLNFTGSWLDTRGYYSKDVASVKTQSTLKQYLYKGGKVVNTIEQNEYKFVVAQALLDKTKIETILEVKKAFYTLLLAEEFMNLNKSIQENTQDHLDFIKQRYKNGQASQSDVLTIEANLSNVKQAYQSSLNQIESSQILLANLLYLDKDVWIKPIAQFTFEPREIAIDQAFLKAMENRPEIKQYQAQEKVDKRAVEIAKADTRPSIYASWDYYSSSTTSLTFSPSKGWQDYNVLGLTFSWPIFDGFATKAKVERAIVELKQTQIMRDKTIRDIASELKNAYLSLKNAISKIEKTESDLVVYKENLITIDQKYNQGITSSLDLNDASLKLAVALFNQKESIYDYIIAKSSFDKATGGI